MAVVNLKDRGRAPKNGRDWLADFRDANGRRHFRRFHTKRDATTWEREQITLRDSGSSSGTREAERLTVDELFALWLESLDATGGRGGAGVARSTRIGYANIHGRWIAPALGGVKLKKLSRERVMQWRDSMTSNGEQPSPRTRREAVKQLKRLLDYGVRERLLMYNAATDGAGKVIAVPRAQGAKRATALTASQVYRLAAFAKDAVTRDVILLMGFTGLRFGEVAALTAADLDLRTGDLSVTKNASVAGGIFTIGPTKSTESRTVRLGSPVLELIAARVANKPPEAPIFTTPSGAHLRPDNWRTRKFKPAVFVASQAIAIVQRAHGVTETTGGRAWFGPNTRATLAKRGSLEQDTIVVGSAGDDKMRRYLDGDRSPEVVASVAVIRYDDTDFSGAMTPHDLRHTAVSLAVQANLPITAISSIAGHASPAVTLDVYSHLFESDREAVAQSMSRVYSSAWADVVGTEDDGEKHPENIHEHPRNAGVKRPHIYLVKSSEG